MGGTRGVRVGYNPANQELFIRIPVERETTIPPTPFSEISLSIVSDDSGLVMQISTNTVSLFSEFHRFAEIVTEIYEQPNQTAYGAFNLAIQKWQELISSKSILTKDQQVGLYGELLFLNSLIKTHGPEVIVAWTGRSSDIPDRHDFRFNSIDFEIKTTKSSQRLHVIHGLEQLQPNLEHLLYVISIKIVDAGLGSGTSLVDLVRIVRKSLENNITCGTEFEMKLKKSGYKDLEAEHYQERFILSELPVLTLVDDKCPKITNETILYASSPEIGGRISDVQYRINFEGLGNAQGTDFFKKVLGEIEL